jgi:hypothetical protein
MSGDRRSLPRGTDGPHPPDLPSTQTESFADRAREKNSRGLSVYLRRARHRLTVSDDKGKGRATVWASGRLSGGFVRHLYRALMTGKARDG